jgi:tetratricopeptide (TPR) repeat protein
MWGDPHAQLNGRQGQAQQGVDVYGQPTYLGGRYAGVQCKRFGTTKLTKQVIQSETIAAEEFTPPLAKFYIATTKPRDVKVQAMEREIRDARQQQGKFPIYILFWEDIWAELRKHNDLVAEYYPDFIELFEPFTPAYSRLMIVSEERDAFRSNYQKAIETSLNEQFTALRLEVNNGFAETARSKIVALVERMEAEHPKAALDAALRENIYLFAAGAFVTDPASSSQARVAKWLADAHANASVKMSDKRGIIEALSLYQSQGAQSALRRLETVTSDDTDRIRFGIWLEEHDFDSCRALIGKRTDLAVSPSKDWQRLLALYHALAGDRDAAKVLARDLAQTVDNADHLVMAAHAMAVLAYRDLLSFCEAHQLCPTVHMTDLDLESLKDVEARQLAADWFERAFYLFHAHASHEPATKALEAALRLHMETGERPDRLIGQLENIDPLHPLLWLLGKESGISEQSLQQMLTNLSIDPQLILSAVVPPGQNAMLSQQQAAKAARTLQQHVVRFESPDALFTHYLLVVLALVSKSAHASAVVKWIDDAQWPSAYPHMGQLARAFVVRKDDASAASSILDALLGKYPRNPEVLLFASQHYRDLRDRARELSCARSLFDVLRTAQTATLFIDSLFANKDFDACYDLLGQIADIEIPEDKLRRVRAYAAGETGRFIEAQHDFEWLAANAACTFDDYLSAAWINQALGDSNRAIALLRQCVDKYPDRPEGYIELARTCLSAGQNKDAFQWALEARRRFPDDPAVAAYVVRVMFPAGGDNHPIAKDLFSAFAPNGPFADSGFLQVTTLDDIQKALEQGVKSNKAAFELYVQSQLSVGLLCHLWGETQFEFHHIGNRFGVKRYIAAGDAPYHDNWLTKHNPSRVALDYTALLTLWSLYQESWLSELQIAFQEIYISVRLPNVVQVELHDLSHQGQPTTQQSREQVLSIVTRLGPGKVVVHPPAPTNRAPSIYDPKGSAQEVALADEQGLVYLCEYPDSSVEAMQRCGLRCVADALLDATAINADQHAALTTNAQSPSDAQLRTADSIVQGMDIVADPSTLQRFADSDALNELLAFVGKVHLVQPAIAYMQQEIDKHNLHDEVVQSLRRLHASLGQAMQRGAVKAMAAPAAERISAKDTASEGDAATEQGQHFNQSRQLLVEQLVDLLYIAEHKQVPIWTDDRWTCKLHDAHVPRTFISTDMFIEWRRKTDKQDARRFGEYEKLITWGYSGLPVHVDYVVWLLRQQQQKPNSPRLLRTVNTYRAYVLEVWQLVRENKNFQHELAFQVYGNFHQAVIRLLQLCRSNRIAIDVCATLFEAFDLSRHSSLAEGMEPTFYAALLLDAFIREPIAALNPREDAGWAEGFGHWLHSVLEASGMLPMVIQEAWHQVIANAASLHSAHASDDETEGLRRWIHLLFLAAPDHVQAYLLQGELRSSLATIFGDEPETFIIFTEKIGNEFRRFLIPQNEWERDTRIAIRQFLQRESDDWIIEGSAAVKITWLSSGSLHGRIEETSAALLKASPNATGKVMGLWLMLMASSDDPTERAAFWRQGLKALTLAEAPTNQWLALRGAFEGLEAPDGETVDKAQRILLSNFLVFKHLLYDAAQISGLAVQHVLVYLRPHDIQAWLDMPDIDWTSADELKTWAHQRVERVAHDATTPDDKIKAILDALTTFGHTLFPDIEVWQRALSDLLERQEGTLEAQLVRVLNLAQNTVSLPLKVTLAVVCAVALRTSSCTELSASLCQALDSIPEQIAVSCAGSNTEAYVRLQDALCRGLYTRWATDNTLQHQPALALTYLAYVGAWVIIQELYALGKPSRKNLEQLREHVVTEVGLSWLNNRQEIRQPPCAFRPSWNAYAKYPLAGWFNRLNREGIDKLPVCRESTVDVIHNSHQASAIVRAFMPGINEQLSWIDELLAEPFPDEKSAKDTSVFAAAFVNNSLTSDNEQEIVSAVALCFLAGSTAWTETSFNGLRGLTSTNHMHKIMAIPAAYEELLWQLAELLVTQENTPVDVRQSVEAQIFDVHANHQPNADILATQASVLARLAMLDLFVDQTAQWLDAICQNEQVDALNLRCAIRPFIAAWSHFPTNVKNALHSHLLAFAKSSRLKNMWEAVRLLRDVQNDAS